MYAITFSNQDTKGWSMKPAAFRKEVLLTVCAMNILVKNLKLECLFEQGLCWWEKLKLVMLKS